MSESRAIENEFGYLDLAPIGMFVLREDSIVLHWNRCLEDWTGIPRHKIVGSKSTSFFPDLAAPKYVGRLRGVFEGGPPVIFSSQLHTYIIPAPLRDGHARIQHTTVTAMPTVDGTFHALFAIQDVTHLVQRLREYRRMRDRAVQEADERERAERKVRHYAAELEERNEEVRRFAYIVSHDLRAPLVNLRGFCAEIRLALQSVEPLMSSGLTFLDDEQREIFDAALTREIPEALEFIDASATRMDRFVGELLRLSRVGSRVLEFETIDMNAVIQESLGSLAHQIEQSRTTVSVDPLPEVIADLTSMAQIADNLLSNALKYLEPERPGRIKISGERLDDETIFRIEDNGRGIAQDDIDKVFLPFRRLGRQDTQGTGIGLTHVQTIVRRHGGRIWCESELGVGTAFAFTISHDAGVKAGSDAASGDGDDR